MTDYLYFRLEQKIRDEIKSGQRKIGDRLPSVRQMCTESSFSKSTVLTAYSRLEAEGLIRAQSRSGYFVTGIQRNHNASFRTPALSNPALAPTFVSADQVLIDIMESGAAFDIIPHNDYHDYGNEQLRRCLGRAQRSQSSLEQQYYDEPMGLNELRSQLAQIIGHGGGYVDKDEVLITSGCQHSLLIALLACTNPGDVVAVESPGFYGFFQLLECLGLQVIELPSSAETGVSPEALSLALDHWDIKALMISPNFSTPTGACMPEENMLKILKLAQTRGVTIIEDDIYGELYFGHQRPRTLYSHDTNGSVILCSSFSKSLSRDLRLGWIASRKHIKKIKQLKLVTALATSVTLQKGVSLFIQEGGLDRHFRGCRKQYQTQYEELLHLVSKYLPFCLGYSQPGGGLTNWLELPEKINTLELYTTAKEEGIIIAPGRLFTSQQRYDNFLRLSFFHPWSDSRVSALKKLGQLLRPKC